MRFRTRLLAFGTGALFAGVFLWPLAGAIGSLQSRSDATGRNDRPDIWLLDFVEQYRPEWIPHVGHMAVALWPAPNPKFDKGCWEELKQRQIEAIYPQKSNGFSNVVDAIRVWRDQEKDRAVRAVEFKAISSLPSGMIAGCIEGSLAAPLCTRMIRQRVRAALETARPRLEETFADQVNKVEQMACGLLERRNQ